MNLISDPFQVFRNSKTPAGLYARKKWLGEASRPNFKNDFDETVDFLLSGQAPDGSWHQSFIKTLTRLFGLHLTVREEIEPARKGLDWLMSRTWSFHQQHQCPRGERISQRELAGLPFTKGSGLSLTIGATLFLFCVFGRETDPDVLKIYNRLEAEGRKGPGRWGGWPSFNNILRAFVVHPRYSKSEAVTLAVKDLGRMQKPSGIWAGNIPFYQTLNALAHLDSAEGDAQLAPAFELLSETQKRDGTWSRSDPEWNTFLVVHALKNKGNLSLSV